MLHWALVLLVLMLSAIAVVYREITEVSGRADLGWIVAVLASIFLAAITGPTPSVAAKALRAELAAQSRISQAP
jgi:hypothetical protein